MSHLFWLASYPKSGNTWLRIFLAHWFHGKDVDINRLGDYGLGLMDTRRGAWLATLGAIPEDHEDQFAVYQHVQRQIACSRSGQSLCKTHNAAVSWRGHPLINQEVTSGAVYMVRDPRSVCLSMMRHYDWTEEQAVECLNSFSASITTKWGVYEYLSDWSTHVESWSWAPFVRYEELWESPVQAFSSILEVLGEKTSRAKVEQAHGRSKLTKLRKFESEKGFSEALNGKFFGKGGTRWMENLSSAAVSAIECRHGQMMERMGYRLSTSLAAASGSRPPATTEETIRGTPGP